MESSPQINPASDRTFKNLLKVLPYLQTAGYSISRTRLYSHSNSGLIRKTSDGAYDQREVDRYASVNLKLIDGAVAPPKNKKIQQLQEDRLQATTAIAIEQARYWQKRNLDFEMEWEARKGAELAARASLFLTDLRNFFHASIQEVISLVNGDQTLAPDLLEYFLNALDGVLVRYVDPSFKFSSNSEVYTGFLDRLQRKFEQKRTDDDENPEMMPLVDEE